MKLIIEYDSITGESVPDGKLYTWLENKIKLALALESPLIVTTSTSLVIEEARALIFEGALSHEDIVFKFKEEEILVDKFGTPTHWPVGFCDIYSKTLRRLIKSTSKRNINKNVKMQNIMDPMLDLAISTLRLDDAPSADGVHLSDKQRLSLLETVWKSIPYKIFDEVLNRTGKQHE